MTTNFSQTIHSLSSDLLQNNREIDLYIPLIGQFQSEGNFHWKQRAVSVVPHIVLNGKGTIRANGTSYEVAGGDIFFFFPGQNLEYFDTSEFPWHYIWFPLLGKSVVWAVEQCGVKSSAPYLQNQVTPQLISFLTKMVVEFSDYTAIESIASAWIFLSHIRPKTQLKIEKPTGLLEQCKMFLDHPGLSNMTIHELSRMSGIDRSTLYRKFTRQSGKSPKSYLSQARLEMACDLLLNSTKTNKEIAYSCGFADPDYFCKFFTKKYGLAPGKWRKQQMADLSK